VSTGGDKIARRRRRAGGREYLIKNAPSSPPAQMSADEWEKALDECFDAFPATGPLPDDAFSRENIYGREDKW
jgi:hypothetical protein